MGLILLNGTAYSGYDEPPCIYSEEEREIGVWTDGKPLYQKTVPIGNLTKDTSWHSINHNISDVDKIVNGFGIWVSHDNEESYPLPNYRPTRTEGIHLSAGRTVIEYINNWQTVTNGEAYVTVQYTKTTDVPGSGKWESNGALAKHYSLQEQVIGTWIDGKPLYEKTLSGSFTNSSSSAQWIVILSPSDVTALNIDSFVHGFGSFKDTFGDNYPVPNNTGSQLGLGIIDDGLCLRIQDVGNGTVYYRLTIQYTKTTD